MFRRDLQQFLVAAEKDGCEDEVKLAILIWVIGSTGNDIYDNFSPQQMRINIPTRLSLENLMNIVLLA